MSGSAADPREEAVEHLVKFGLNSYAARTYVALVGLGSGTASDVSDVSDVPRTRVYDAAKELHQRGLVDIQESTPRSFWPVSSETTGRKFEHEFAHRARRLTSALNGIEPLERREEQHGVWTVTGHAAVMDRVVEFFDTAEEEIVYMTVEELLTDDVIGELSEATDRGVSIKLAGISPVVQDRIQDDVPGAEMFESLWVWSDTPAGRLLMVDGNRTLVSVLTNGEDDAPDDPPAETAIWGSGETNSLVVVLKAIFAWRLGNPDEL